LLRIDLLLFIHCPSYEVPMLELWSFSFSADARKQAGHSDVADACKQGPCSVPESGGGFGTARYSVPVGKL
jgi:hypothetical protein